MKKFIYYPGFDPINQNNLITFFIENDTNIIFLMCNSNRVVWSFNTTYDAKKGFAFLLHFYTDKEKDLYINDLAFIKDYNCVEISGFSMIFYHDKKSIEEFSYRMDTTVDTHLIYHSLVLELIYNKDFKIIWNALSAKPYPLTVNPLNKIK